jgi:hypothetical protein
MIVRPQMLKKKDPRGIHGAVTFTFLVTGPSPNKKPPLQSISGALVLVLVQVTRPNGPLGKCRVRRLDAGKSSRWARLFNPEYAFFLMACLARR